ncbi:MAG TPA: two-component regulator propeller domain-containing protein [Bacteroidia bacterium]|nr:two-component regulator propeller domain-containing protein [Bacteroidia bacterium]
MKGILAKGEDEVGEIYIFTNTGLYTMKDRYVIILLLMLISMVSNAQTNWTVYDTTNSALPHNTVYKVVEDNLGNIWASTQNGLAKFDGNNWTIYDSVPGSNYALKNLFAMVYDHVNDWLYVDMPGVLIRFDGTNWNTWTHGGYSNEDLIDSQGRVWMALYNLGVGVFDGNTFAYYDTSNSAIPDPKIIDIEQDLSGNIWAISLPGLARFDGNSWTVFDTTNSPLPSSSIFGMGIDHNNLLWVHGSGLQSGTFLYSFDGNAWTAYDTTICQLISAYSFIEADASNNIWIGTYGAGLQMINNISCATFTDQNSPLPTNYFHDIYITANQTLWIATQINGLIKVDLPVGLEEAQSDPGFKVYPNPVINKIIIDKFPGGYLKIVDIMGAEIYSSVFPTSESIEIYVNDFTAGVYFLQYTGRNTKFVKQ